MSTFYGYPQYMKRQQPKQVEVEVSKPQIEIEGLPAEVVATFKLEPTAGVNKGDTWILTTAAGEVLLKEEKGDLTELQERLNWQQYLRDNGICSIPKLLRTEQGNLVSSSGKAYYGWLRPQGELFQGKDVQHLYSVITTLAKIQALSIIYEQHHQLPQNFDWPLQIQARLTELLVFSRQMSEHRLNDDFQRIFMENFGFIYDQGQEAVQKMILADCTSNCKGNFINLIDNFLPENLLISEGGAMFCNLTTRQRGPRVLDLANFLRSYLGEHCWDFNLLKGLIQCYQEIAPLSGLEKQLFLSMMRFPVRFWFYSRQYRLREKGISELSAKLINLINEVRLRDRCLDSLDSLLSEGE